jgi:hypothetical protein
LTLVPVPLVPTPLLPAVLMLVDVTLTVAMAVAEPPAPEQAIE